MHAAKGREFDHVYVLGLMSARMPGPRRRALEPIPDALLKEALPPDSKAAHVGRDAAPAARRHDARAPAARARLPRRDRARRRAAAVAVRRGGARARSAASGSRARRSSSGPAETLQSTFRLLRDELMTTVAQVGGRLGELRFDTDLDVSHAVVRYLELLEALRAARAHARGRPVGRRGAARGQRAAAAGRHRRAARDLRDLGARRLPARRRARREAAPARGRAAHASRRWSRSSRAAATGSCSARPTSRPTGRARCATSSRASSGSRRSRRSTSASGSSSTRCSSASTRGGADGRSLPELLGLLEAGWRRGGFGDSEEERQLRAKATQALLRYHERFQGEDGEPVWFERSFAFSLGPHLLRGRVDRVDRLPDGGYELIDYKTGRPEDRRAAARGRAALALRRRRARVVAARGRPPGLLLRARRREGARRALRRRPRLDHGDGLRGRARASSSQGFEPTPSWAACSMCDYRIACPAAEK